MASECPQQAGAGQGQTRGPEPHETKVQAAATKEQAPVGRAFCQGRRGQIEARKVGPGRKGSSCTKPACQHLAELRLAPGRNGQCWG